jgi:hypothetical protein
MEDLDDLFSQTCEFDNKIQISELYRPKPIVRKIIFEPLV